MLWNQYNILLCSGNNFYSHLKHLHHFVAEVVDDFDGDAAGFGFFERAGGVAVECGPGFGVGLVEDDEEVAFANKLTFALAF